MKSLLLLSALSIIIIVNPSVFAEPFSVTTSKAAYVYGDYLSFTVTIPEVSKQVAIFRIVDDAGIASSSIDMGITGTSTVLTAPNPFSATIFKEGKYTIEIEYDGKITSTEFILMDSGKIVIPFWIKDVAGLWIENVINDTGFMKNLIDNEIIMIESIDEQTEFSVPSWYKINAELWRNQNITDDEFAKGLQYLISINAISTEK